MTATRESLEGPRAQRLREDRGGQTPDFSQPRSLGEQWKPSKARRRGYCADSGFGGVWARLFRWTVSGRPGRPGLEAQTADAREVTALAVAAGETGDLRRTGTPGEDTLGEGVFAGCPRTWGSGTAPPSRLLCGA